MGSRNYRADVTLALILGAYVASGVGSETVSTTTPPPSGPCGGRYASTQGYGRLIDRVMDWMQGPSPIDENTGRLPLSFEMNVGQSDAKYQFLASGEGHYVFVSADSLVLDLRDRADAPGGIVEMGLPGANGKASWQSLEALPGRVNYIVGNNPANWKTNIPTYARVRYRDVYPGIDIDYYGRQEELEYDFVVRPGADPNAIAMQFKGDVEVSLEEGGALAVRHGERLVRWHKPRIHQAVASGTRQIDGGYKLEGNGKVRFSVGSYNKSAPLVIDPVVQYSTLVGKTLNEAAFGVTADSQGNTYLAGTTTSPDYPTSPGSPTTTSAVATTGDVVITKLNSTGTAMIYSTRIGGTGRDVGTAIYVDEGGNAYVTGSTTAEDFPLSTNAYQRRLAGKGLGDYATGDCFVLKLNAAGTALTYSTYLGGAQSDMCGGIAVDKSGNAFVAGMTGSSNFPVSENAYQRSFRGGGEQANLRASDAFVTKLNPQGSALVYSTFVGGTLDDVATSVAIDAAGAAYVTGFTSSTNFPVTSGAPQRTYGGSGGGPTITFGDGFLFKINVDGTALAYSTFLGGLQDDAAYDVAVDSQGNAYVVGNTLSTNFPVTDQAYQKTYKGSAGTALGAAGDVFVTKVNATGTAWVYSTYLGGAKDEAAMAVALDANNNVHVTGHTTSTNFPLSADARQTTYKGESTQNSVITGDAFYSQLNASGSALVYSTYLGGFSDDIGLGIAIDSKGNVLVAGGSSSSDFPVTSGVYQPGFAGGQAGPNFPVGDAFVARFGAEAAQPGSDISIAGVASAASYVGGGVTAGEMIVLAGVNIGPATLAMYSINNNVVSNTVGETRVLFDDVAAPIIYVSATQSSVMVPYSVAGKQQTSIVVERRGVRSAPLVVPVLAAKPALFTATSSGRGQGAILNEDYTYNSSVAAERGRLVILFGTGEGATSPAGVDGQLALSVFPKPLQPMTATIGGREAKVLYYGAAPQQVAGMFQMNVEVPADIPPGNAEVIVSVGSNRSAAGVTVAVK